MKIKSILFGIEIVSLGATKAAQFRSAPLVCVLACVVCVMLCAAVANVNRDWISSLRSLQSKTFTETLKHTMETFGYEP